MATENSAAILGAGEGEWSLNINIIDLNKTFKTLEQRSNNFMALIHFFSPVETVFTLEFIFVTLLTTQSNAYLPRSKSR